MKKLGKVLLGIVAAVVIIIILLMVLAQCNRYDPTDKMNEIKWPGSAIAALIPTPESTFGTIDMDRADYLAVDIGKTDKDAFNAYVEACMAAGFMVDYSRSDSGYYAENEEGYHLSISYYDEYEKMNISINAPSEEEETEATEATTAAKKKKKEKKEQKKKKEKKSSDGVDPDFKKLMDGYEEFFDEYVDILKKYKENPSDLSILAEYTEIMEEYTDTMEELDDIDQDDLSEADLAYYLEVYSRIMKKISEL